MLKSEIPQSGLYFIPWHDKNSSPDEVRKKTEAGPFAYMMIHPNGMSMDMLPNMAMGFLVNCFMCLLVTWLLMRTKGLSFIQKVGFVKMAGLCGSTWLIFANWNWWGYPNTYLIVNIVDQSIAWGAVGLGLAKFVVKD